MRETFEKCEKKLGAMKGKEWINFEGWNSPIGPSGTLKEDHKSQENEFIALTQNYRSIDERLTMQVDALKRAAEIQEMHLMNDLEGIKTTATVDKQQLEEGVNDLRSQIGGLVADAKLLFERVALLEESQNGLDRWNRELEISPGTSIFEDVLEGDICSLDAPFDSRPSNHEMPSLYEPPTTSYLPIPPPSPVHAARISDVIMAPDSVGSVLVIPFGLAQLETHESLPTGYTYFPIPPSPSTTTSDSLSKVPPRGLHDSEPMDRKSSVAERFKCSWMHLATNWVHGKCPAFLPYLLLITCLLDTRRPWQNRCSGTFLVLIISFFVSFCSFYALPFWVKYTSTSSSTPPSWSLGDGYAIKSLYIDET